MPGSLRVANYSEQLYAAASRVIPGGVNSPVRAWHAVGGTPLFVQRGRGAQIVDADGRTYVDFVGSWGPLVLGHAQPQVVADQRRHVLAHSGRRAGKEAVLVYVSDLVASLSPPNRRLRRFAKVNLEPNQSRTLTFKLRRDDLSFIGADNKPIAEPGEFEVRIGDLSQRFRLR